MEVKSNAGARIQRGLIILTVVLFVIGGCLALYNKQTEQKAIDDLKSAIRAAYGYEPEYVKGSNNIKVNFHIENEVKLLNLSKRALAQLAMITKAL